MVCVRAYVCVFGGGGVRAGSSSPPSAVDSRHHRPCPGQPPPRTARKAWELSKWRISQCMAKKPANHHCVQHSVHYQFKKREGGEGGREGGKGREREGGREGVRGREGGSKTISCLKKALCELTVLDLLHMISWCCDIFVLFEGALAWAIGTTPNF
jgi:hypothetical protein